MDGNVDATLEQRFLELLHEDAARADLAERLRPVAVARGRDGDARDLDARCARARRGELRPREREPTAAAADAKPPNGPAVQPTCRTTPPPQGAPRRPRRGPPAAPAPPPL